MSALDDAIDAAEELVESEYTESSWAALDTALDAALLVQADRYHTTPQITAATAALTAATEALVPLTVETPTADPVAGEVTSGTTVELACETDGATIYYTTDGGTPDDESTEYAAPIEVTATVTIKAIAYKGAMNPSGVLSAAYTIAGG